MVRSILSGYGSFLHSSATPDDDDYNDDNGNDDDDDNGYLELS